MLRKLLAFVVCLMAAVATASAQTPPYNEIWYTTTDGRPLFINRGYKGSVGLYMYSDTYNNGRGVLKFESGGYINFINSGLFNGNDRLKSITIPNSVTSIGEDAFWYCSSLTSITIPNSVTSIGRYAFYGCSSLTSITIPNSVTSIGEGAFAICSSLKSVKVSNKYCCDYFKGMVANITFYGANASANGRCLIIDGKLIAYAPTELTSYTIPNGVTSIGEDAFAGCSSLTSITIPNSVTEIGGSAFYGGGSLTSITIPNSVTSIGGSAFYGCSSLTSITIPNSVTEIGYRAFYDCSSLTSITIGNSVTSIGGSAFSGCSSLTSITIPESVTEIGWNAFESCNSLTSITIGNSVTSIGWYAFRYCSSLTSITIGNSVTSIGQQAFRGCSSLKSVKVANKDCYDYFKKLGVSDITFAVSTPKEYEEAQKLGATKLDIDSNSKYASEDGLCLIDNGKLILFIGKDLTEYTIPESVTSIRKGTFKGCSNLKSFKGKFASEDGRCLIKDGELIAFAPAGLTSYTIPNSVTSIEYSAFAGCSSLKSVKVSNKYCYDYFKDKVDDIAFYGANASEDGRCLIIDGELKIFIAKGITEYTIPNSATSIGRYAFSHCNSLTSITIPNSVTSIGEGAFRYCSSLNSITIPNSVTSIGVYAFYDCSSLKSITIGNSVTSIGRSAFNGCSSLTSITIPDSVTSIGNDAFHGCSSLTSITIPDSVTSIEGSAFEGCSSLTSITCLATTPPATDDLSIAETTMIYVPKEAVKVYKKDPKWSIYKKQIKAIK